MQRIRVRGVIRRIRQQQKTNSKILNSQDIFERSNRLISCVRRWGTSKNSIKDEDKALLAEWEKFFEVSDSTLSRWLRYIRMDANRTTM